MADIARDADKVVVELVEEDEAGAGPADDLPVIDEEGGEELRLPAHAKPQPDGSVILPLKRPFTLRYRTKSSSAVREEPMDQLHLHRLTGVDMRAIAAAEKDSMTVTLARAMRQHEGRVGRVLDAMDGANVAAAFDVVAVFLGSGRKTGR